LQNQRWGTKQHHICNTEKQCQSEMTHPPRLVGRCVLKSRRGDIGGGWLGAAGNPRGYLQSRSVGLKGSDSGRRSIAATGGRERGKSFITRPAGWHTVSFWCMTGITTTLRITSLQEMNKALIIIYISKDKTVLNLSTTPWKHIGGSAFFDLGIRWNWVVNFMPWMLYHHGKIPRYPLDHMHSSKRKSWYKYE